MKSAYRATSRFVLRTPLLPFDHGRSLAELAADPVVREALALSSPELDAALELADPSRARAFARYVARMAGRATPFGLCAGISLGTLGAATQLELGARATYRRAVRLDHDHLASACDALARQLRERLPHRPSSSLYVLGDRLRYVEVRRADDHVSHHLVEVERSEPLDALLAATRDGATPEQLVAVLCADPDVAREDAEAFVGELIDTQVLVPELAVPVTGEDAALAIAAQLSRAGAAHEAARVVDARDRLVALDREPLGVPRATYEAIAPLRDLRADLFKPAQATLGPRVVTELQRALELLAMVGAPARRDPWPEFRAAFEARYGTREVPLVEVLDEEAGIGFGERSRETAPLLAGLGIASERAAAASAAWGEREVRLLQLATRGTHEVELTDDDLAQIARDRSIELPATVLLGAVLGAASPEALDRGDFTLRVVGAGGPGPRPLARLCDESPELAELVRELIAAEEALAPDAVFAEVAHVPEGRGASVVWRPVLRGHEIEYLGASGAPRDRQLPVTDLLVSLAGERVVVRSRTLGREVIPRLTSAHDFTNDSLAMYRFLAACSWLDGQPARWSWGVLDDAAFLPRVRRGRIVLARARWVLAPDELARPLAEVRARRGLPRWIALADDDRELPVDLDDATSADMFLDRVKRRPRAVVHELYPAPDQLVVRGPEGRFVHELIVPFVRTEPVARPAVAPSGEVEVERRFTPGSRWVYAKLYGGVAGTDRVLRDVIAPMVRSGEVWFFLRYADPDPHLRVRWHDRDAGEVIDELRSRLADAGEPCWRVVLDTYEREVERYGGARGIELAEQVFAADSEAVLSLLADDLDDDRRALLALRGIDALLDDLGIPDKLALATAARDAYAAELGVVTWHHKRLGELYRARKDAIEAALAEDVPAFAARSAYIRPLVGELRACDRPIDDLARSFVHVHVNRMLATAQRAQELVLYDLLRRTYAARAARAVSS